MRTLNTGLVLALPLLMTGMLANGQMANGEMIVNGDFETPDITEEWAFYNQIPGWKAAFGTIEIQSGPGMHTGSALPPGTQFIELDAEYNSSMFQDIRTETGKQYMLSFYYAPRNGFDGMHFLSHTTGIDVFWENEILATVVENGPPEHVNNWNQYSFTVTANDPLGISRLQFNAAGNSDSYGGLLDKVELAEIIIPEPSSLALISLGFVGMLAFSCGAVSGHEAIVTLGVGVGGVAGPAVDDAYDLAEDSPLIVSA